MRRKKANLSTKQKIKYLTCKFVTYTVIYAAIEIALYKLLILILDNCITTL